MKLNYTHNTRMRVKLFFDWGGAGENALAKIVQASRNSDNLNGYSDLRPSPKSGKYRMWYDRIASPSQPVLVRRLGKDNIEKLERLIDAPSRTFVPGVGFHTPYRFAEDTVYCIDAGAYTAGQRDTERQILPFTVVEHEDETRIKHMFIHQANHIRGRYVDTLTKGQRAKLAMLQVMASGEEGRAQWLDGIGGVMTKRTYAGRTLGYAIHTVYVIVKDPRYSRV